MKIRCKMLVFTLLSFVFNLGLSAQQVKFGLAPELNLPTGNASNISGVGFGGALTAEVSIATKYALTASGGYNLFIGKKYFGSRSQNISALPVKLGLKYYSIPDFYLEAQVGAAFHQGTASKTSLVWSPGFGTYFRTDNNKQKIAFGIRYEAWTNTSYGKVNTLKTTSFGFIGLKLGYQFGL